jgi:PPM family protein phosphatase
VTERTADAPLLAYGAATNSGLVRDANEDAFVAEPMVFVVADGMGGHQAGEVASAIAASTLHDRLLSGATSVDVAVAAVVEANAAIFQGAHSHAEQRGMGTTLTAVVVITPPEVAPRLAVLNVGDSRVYVQRGTRLRRVSIDHSYVQELVSTGHITELEARNHPRRNIVTRALGIEPTVKVDTWLLPLVRGDRYLLCSDGLVDEVDDDEIGRILHDHAQPQAAADALVAAANEHGGHDNTTVVVIDVLEGDEPPHDTADLGHQAVAIDEDDGEAYDEEHERLIEADAPLPMLAVGPITTHAPIGAPAPIGHTPLLPPQSPRRRGVGTLLFVIALAAIVTLTVVLVLVVKHNADNSPTTTTTPSSTTTQVTTPATTPSTTPTSGVTTTVATSGP